MRQRDLEIRLERVPHAPDPSPGLEQYRTPPKIAADLLYRALARGDVAERSVLDLGCGTGMFAIGALLLGASRAHGIDLDAKSLELAARAAAELDVAPTFQRGDVEAVEGAFDTCLMNPPFGAQFAARHEDTRFLEVALQHASVCYSLHLAETQVHLARTAGRLGLDAAPLASYDFPLPAQFAFHRKERHIVPVVLYRFERRGASA